MDRYLGLDAHALSCTLGVVGPSGKRLSSQVMETNARALIEGVRAVPGKRHLCMEEGTLSGWLYEVLEPLGSGAVRPTLRVGAGAKIYSFDLYHARSPVVAPTADIGAGFEAGSGPVRFFTEARWLPSRFDARMLPIRATDNHRQLQNDWALQVGFRARP